MHLLVAISLEPGQCSAEVFLVQVVQVFVLTCKNQFMSHDIDCVNLRTERPDVATFR